LVNQLGIKTNPRVHALSASHEKKPRGRHSNSRGTAVCTYRQGIRRIESNRAKKKAERRTGQWPSGNSRGWEAAGGGSSPRPAPGCRDSVCVCVCDGMCACVWVCVSLGMVCFETTQVVSYAMSSVNVGVQKSYMTPQCFWMLSKKKQRETRLRNESKPNEGDRKYYSGPGYRGTRYPGRTFCFEICDPLSHMSVFRCICNFLSNVSPNTLPGGAR